MKLRAPFLAFAFLLTGTLTNAAQIAAPADPASASLAAIFSSPDSSDCQDAKLPSLQPAPTDKAAIGCGGCSDTICQGKAFHSFCKVEGGKTYTCEPALFVCSSRDCQCWTGPLP
jgi:hypothetical protein